MKRIVSIMLTAVAIMSSCTDELKHKTIAPIPADEAITAMKDCCVPAKFTIEDFNWESRTLTMRAYNADRYDVVSIINMQKGDTLIYNSEPIVVNKIEPTNDYIQVNGDIEEGGCCLVLDGTAYRPKCMDDHTNYTDMNVHEIPLADNFVITDCGLDPHDKDSIIDDNQRVYLESLKDSRREFYPINTFVGIKDGKITDIIRRWIP